MREQMGKECTTGCNKDWLKCALEVLKQNNQHPYVYAAAIRDLLINVKGKFRNIMIIGPTNCGKTFMLKSLELIYDVFSNPANDKYAWVGADAAEIIVLQDFRWCHDSIPLEGSTSSSGRRDCEVASTQKPIFY